MKKKLIYIILLFGLFVSAQNQRVISLNWNDGMIYNYVDQTYKYPGFDGVFYNIDRTSKEIFFKKEEFLENNVDPKSLRVTNIS